MTILGIDGATPLASVTLYNGGVISTVSGLTGATSETLAIAVDKVLRDGGISVSDVDIGAVTSGPGSFTGIRVAMSLMKGLFFGREIVTVSTLYAIATAAGKFEERFTVRLDARASKYYAADFCVNGGDLQRMSADAVFDVTADTVFTEFPPLSEYVCKIAENSQTVPADTAMPTFILLSQAERIRKGL